jgi:hypothetical protein
MLRRPGLVIAGRKSLTTVTLQITLRSVVERRWDHVRLLDDFPNSTTLAQEIVVGSVLPITEILVIEDLKLHCTFLHVAFRS